MNVRCWNNGKNLKVSVLIIKPENHLKLWLPILITGSQTALHFRKAWSITNCRFTRPTLSIEAFFKLALTQTRIIRKTMRKLYSWSINLANPCHFFDSHLLNNLNRIAKLHSWKRNLRLGGNRVQVYKVILDTLCSCSRELSYGYWLS